MNKNIIISLFVLSALYANAQDLKNPSFEEVISLESVYNPLISPDGKHLVFQSTTTDWEENRFDRELWLSKNGDAPFQLTNNLENNSTNPKWSPDGKWISFVS